MNRSKILVISQIIVTFNASSFQVRLGEVNITKFESNKVRALLAYLAVEREQAHRREKLAALLWPDMPARRANANLSQTLYNLRDQVTEVTLTLESVGQEGRVVSALEGSLPGYEIDSWDTLRPEMRETMDMKSSFTGILGIVVVLIASIGVLNLMLMAAFERTREMGVLAAMGMKGRQIMGLFLLEGTFIGAVGGAVGCGLGALCLGLLARNGLDFSFASGMGQGSEMIALLGDKIYPSISLTDYLSRGLTVAIIAALASFYPAWQASRQEPADALHHV